MPERRPSPLCLVEDGFDALSLAYRRAKNAGGALTYKNLPDF